MLLPFLSICSKDCWRQKWQKGTQMRGAGSIPSGRKSALASFQGGDTRISVWKICPRALQWAAFTQQQKCLMYDRQGIRKKEVRLRLISLRESRPDSLIQLSFIWHFWYLLCAGVLGLGADYRRMNLCPLSSGNIRACWEIYLSLWRLGIYHYSFNYPLAMRGKVCISGTQSQMRIAITWGAFKTINAWVSQPEILT